jgi:hypothetical protein
MSDQHKRRLWLRKTLRATDDLLAKCRRDSEAVDTVAAMMGEQRFGEMIAELRKLRARLASELEQLGKINEAT